MKAVEVVQDLADKAAWREKHVGCPWRGRLSDRSTVSRTFTCFYYVLFQRCMFRLCPRVVRNG